MKTPEDVLRFWFGEDDSKPLKNASKWYKQDEGFDQLVKRAFEEPINLAIEAKLNSWRQTPKGCLAYIILLDQFSRNIFRGSPKAYKQDVLALAASLAGQEKQLDQALNIVERWFFYMPMMHAEDLDIQKRSVERYKELLDEAPETLKSTIQNAYDYAIRHKVVVERFGRFPHQNDQLGRESTDEEKAFLNSPDAPF